MKVYTRTAFPGSDFLTVHLFKVFGAMLLVAVGLTALWFEIDLVIGIFYSVLALLLVVLSRLHKKFAYKVVLYDNDKIDAFMNSGEVVSGSLSDVKDYKRMLYVFFRIGERKVVLKDIYDQELLDTLEAQN